MYLVAVLRPRPRPRRFLPSRFWRRIVPAAALSAFPVGAQGLGNPGSEAFPGLRVESSAQAAGMAGAACALPEGTASLGSNPAGLARDLGRTRYAGSLRLHPDGADAGAVAFTHPAWLGQFAVSAAYLDYGSVDALDDQGRPLGVSMRPVSFYPSVAWARALGEQLRVGAAFKLAGEYLGDFQGSQGAMGLGFDLGAQYQPAARNLGFGVALLNVGKKVTGHFQGDTDRGWFPGELHGGLFYHPNGWDQTVVTVDAGLPFQESPYAALGVAYSQSQYWVLRAGTRWDSRDMVNALYLFRIRPAHPAYGSALKAAAGTSLRLGNADVDYALQWWTDLGFVNAVTLSWTLGA